MSELVPQAPPPEETQATAETSPDPDSLVRATGTLAKLLGFSGLLPMAAVLAGQWFLPQFANPLLYLAMLYVGVIFAFLGGIQWGLVLLGPSATDAKTSRRLVVSVLPALVTVVALLIPQALGCLLLAAGLWALLAFEWSHRRGAPHPTWYMPLRINLTAMLSAFLTAALWLA